LLALPAILYVTASGCVVSPVRVKVKAPGFVPASEADESVAATETLGSAGSTESMSMNASLLFDEAVALVMVSRPSVTFTVFVPSTKRDDVVGVPLNTSVFSTLNLKTLSK
jgi:hypothetical protein